VTGSNEQHDRNDPLDPGIGNFGSLRALADRGADYLARCGVPNARNNAEWILCDAANCDRLRIYVDDTYVPPPDQFEKYLTNLRRRAGREPLQYILGNTEFMSLAFHTPPGVFVPRPDTELLVETSEARLRQMPLSPCLRVLDLCCGAGVIAVSLACRIPNLEAWAVDHNARAVAVAGRNATANGVGDRVHAVNAAAESFLATGAVDGSAERGGGAPTPAFAAVVCNPPYIASADVPGLPPEVREHEPADALDGGPDGLLFYRRVVPLLADRIVPGGFAAFEVGATQAGGVSALLSDAGFSGVTVTADYAGLDRVVAGVRPV
jgi:release factor glutamine methyltransferase